jgi:DNA repair exonuclease SbcCD nuclease subunit
VKVVHAADLHIDSPLRGLDRYDGAPVERLRGATRRALENLVAECIDVRADVLLLAGDVFDGGWRDYSTGLFFHSQMVRLREAGVPVVMVRGNHDAISSITRNLRLPDNVHELSAKKPETFELPNAGIAVHGQSFSEKSMSDDLAARYPQRVPGRFNIGLLHTSIDGREGHASYAPTSIATMRQKGYDYWALGHVHAREIVETEPYIVYCGNLQGRHAKETGPKGATVLTIEDRVIVGIEHRALDVVRWEQLVVDVSAATDVHDAVDLVRAALPAEEARIRAIRLTISGATRANGALRRETERVVSELRAMATEHDGVWLEKVLLQTVAPIDLAAVREEASAVGHLARRLVAIKDDGAELELLGAALADLDKKLPAELREEGFNLCDPTTLRALLGDVEQLLIPRLLERES